MSRRQSTNKSGGARGFKQPTLPARGVIMPRLDTKKTPAKRGDIGANVMSTSTLNRAPTSALNAF